MDLRLQLGSLLLLSLPIAAQVPQLVPPVPVPPAGQPAAQDPGQDLDRLKKEKERLLREIDYVHTRVGNAKALLANTLGKRSLSIRSIDAGASTLTQSPTPPMAPRPARLMQPDELSTQPETVMMVVGGNPVTRQAFDELMNYLRWMPIEEAFRAQMALAELIRIEAMASHFADTDVDGQVADVLTQMGQGKSLAEIVKTKGTVKGAKPDGTVELTRNSVFGPRFEMVAFALQPGQTARPFRHHEGVVILSAKSVEKGATPELDKVVVCALQVPYSEDDGAVQKAQMQLAARQVEILARDQAVLEMLPAAYRDPGDLLKDGETPPQVQEALKELSAEIARISASGTAEEKARLPELEAQAQKLKAGGKPLGGKGGEAPAPKKD